MSSSAKSRNKIRKEFAEEKRLKGVIPVKFPGQKGFAGYLNKVSMKGVKKAELSKVHGQYLIRFLLTKHKKPELFTKSKFSLKRSKVNHQKEIERIARTIAMSRYKFRGKSGKTSNLYPTYEWVKPKISDYQAAKEYVEAKYKK